VRALVRFGLAVVADVAQGFADGLSAVVRELS
jgi:hypothetical protein